MLDHLTLRALISWSRIYRPEWDLSPGQYVDNGLAPWGKSRRLGLLKLGRLKAYIGIQHIDPSIPGWSVVSVPEARYFVSILTGNTTTALRTFNTMGSVLDFLGSVLADSAI